jgi:hypothetical protein
MKRWIKRILIVIFLIPWILIGSAVWLWISKLKDSIF